ncbi:MAG: UDP-N-acetylmuramate--L-alanine ligase [Bacteroidales bacterium]|nr:UDP-N-acetylmuramate--L-alanine ligase [Bacteroidales bacterium]
MNDIKNMYFLGIGGIGMSALARYFKAEGKQIFGYDLTSTPLTGELTAEGIHIHFKDDPALVPDDIDMAVFTPAIPPDNKELLHLKKKKIPLLKRAQLIGMLSQNFFTIAIAGTHGKTSISAITAHLMKSAGLRLTALVGGICLNYRSNFIHSERTDYLLVEADEFDRSFLSIAPDIALISSMDADHLDIYKNHDELVSSFREFAGLPGKKGTLIHHQSLPDFKEIAAKIITYGIHPAARIRAVNIRIRGGRFLFDLETEKQKIEAIALQIPGKHYIENALAAAAIGLQLGLDGQQIKSGLESFSGVERRFETRINEKHLVYIDDYAHHPEEIRVTISAVKMLYPDKKITLVFQPHLFSRTRDFAADFAAVLSTVDEVVLLDIYPAREKPIAGITSNSILSKITITNKKIIDKNELTAYLKTNRPELLLTLGAGDIGLLTNEIEKVLKNKLNIHD